MSSCRRWESACPRARSSAGASRSATPIKADETIVEISTDKVDTEVPVARPPARSSRSSCPRARPSTSARAIAVIDTGGGAPLAPAEPRPPRPSRRGARRAGARPRPRPPPPAGRRAAAARRPRHADGGYAAPGDAGCRPAGAAPPAPRRPPTANGESRDLRSFMSPVVARMVAEHGLDIAADPGHRPRWPRDQEGRRGATSPAAHAPPLRRPPRRRPGRAAAAPAAGSGRPGRPRRPAAAPGAGRAAPAPAPRRRPAAGVAERRRGDLPISTIRKVDRAQPARVDRRRRRTSRRSSRST